MHFEGQAASQKLLIMQLVLEGFVVLTFMLLVQHFLFVTTAFFAFHIPFNYILNFSL